MKKGLVSIIVPIFNVEKYLEECINSILNQDYENIEIILINDGSTDGSDKICKKFTKFSNVKYIEQKNSGVSVARNVGIKVATGEWIMFVDGDDYMSTDMVSKLLDIAIKEKCDLVITPPIFEYEKKSINGYIFKNDCEFLDNKEKLELNMICRQFGSSEKTVICVGTPWGKLYNTRLIKDNNCNFIVGLRKMQDVIFNLNFVGKVEKIVYKNINLYHYRLNSNSICHKYNPEIFSILFQVINEFKEFVKINNKGDNYKQAINMRIVFMFIEGMRLSILHKDNKCGFIGKIKKMREIYQFEIVKQAFKDVKLHYLPNSLKIFVILIRYNIFIATYMMIVIFMKTKNKEQT